MTCKKDSNKKVSGSELLKRRRSKTVIQTETADFQHGLCFIHKGEKIHSNEKSSKNMFDVRIILSALWAARILINQMEINT